VGFVSEPKKHKSLKKRRAAAAAASTTLDDDLYTESLTFKLRDSRSRVAVAPPPPAPRRERCKDYDGRSYLVFEVFQKSKIDQYHTRIFFWNIIEWNQFYQKIISFFNQFIPKEHL